MSSLARRAQQDAPWVWFHAGAVSICLLLMFGILGFIGTRGLHHFWPKAIEQVHWVDLQGNNRSGWGQRLFSEEIPDTQQRLQHFNGPKRQDLYFVGDSLDPSVTGEPPYYWLPQSKKNLAQDVYLIELNDGRRLLAKLLTFYHLGQWYLFNESTAVFWESERDQINGLKSDTHLLMSGELRTLREKIANARQELVKQRSDPTLNDQLQKWLVQYQEIENDLAVINFSARQNRVKIQLASGKEYWLSQWDIDQVLDINRMNLVEKWAEFAHRLFIFVSSDGGSASGYHEGVLPAIVGTVLMVFLMTLVVTPLGIFAAVYLHEYAPKTRLTRAMRVGVSNMAAVPSIVYGVFGLGFFIHTLGSSLDFALNQTAEVTWGGPGLLWAALTLALLTLPVVIVTTEEGLARIPQRLREGSLALGATQAETLIKVVLPLVTPAMMTGVILAIARAAGEVAPLMLVGVVKLAPTLPLDSEYPFLHLDRPIMHLGYHLYETALLDPRADAARPVVYAIATLLVTVILTLNFFAIRIRQRLRDRYRMLDL